VLLGTEFGTNASDSWVPGDLEHKYRWYSYLVHHLKKDFIVAEGYQTDRYIDSGQVAILDTLICIKAPLLMPIETSSSFSRKIVAEHEAKGLATNKQIYWDYWGEYKPTAGAVKTLTMYAPRLEINITEWRP